MRFDDNGEGFCEEEDLLCRGRRRWDPSFSLDEPCSSAFNTGLIAGTMTDLIWRLFDTSPRTPIFRFILHFEKECAGTLWTSGEYASPWSDAPCTGTLLGDNCTLPFGFHGFSLSARMQRLSDLYDSDGDGTPHQGHPPLSHLLGFLGASFPMHLAL